MKNLITKPFLSVDDAMEFLDANKCKVDKNVIRNEFFRKGFFIYKKWHIVIDPFGSIQPEEEKTFVGDFMHFIRNVAISGIIGASLALVVYAVASHLLKVIG